MYQMRKLIAATLLAGAALVGGTANAATIVNTSSNLTFVDLTAPGVNKNLSNNGFYATNGSQAYIFFEGLNTAGQQSFLLHYDRRGGLFNGGVSIGSFGINLAAGEVLASVITDSLGLIATDLAGINYTNGVPALLRGLEPGFLPFIGDSTSVGAPNPIAVNFNLQNLGPTLDEVRFLVNAAPAPVPEPATWAMMIAGFGLVGGAMRRRNVTTKVSFA